MPGSLLVSQVERGGARKVRSGGPIHGDRVGRPYVRPAARVVWQW